jgi:hypothetical protein
VCVWGGGGMPLVVCAEGGGCLAFEQVKGFAAQKARGAAGPTALGDLGRLIEQMGLDQSVLEQQWSQLSVSKNAGVGVGGLVFWGGGGWQGRLASADVCLGFCSLERLWRCWAMLTE